MAVATGAIVANLYYAQPMLEDIKAAFGVGSFSGSLFNTLIQGFYALGLILIVPLGDRLPRRAFISAIFASSAVALALAALAPSFATLAIIGCLIGLTAVGGQILLPFAADLAEPGVRGHVLGRMMTGLLIGVLLSRTVSGYISEFASWETAYWVAAGVMVFFAALLLVVLPQEGKRPQVPYGHLVTDSLRLLNTMPELRRRAWLGAMAFGSFSILWSTLAFLLTEPKFDYGTGAIGLFGLLGLIGILAANVAGSLADHRHRRATTIGSAVLIIVAFVIAGIGSSTVVVIAIAIVLIDMGVQGLQITNQTIIYELAPEARSRINSAYMICYFIGGALGSLIAGVLYSAAGWTGVWILGACVGVAALIPALLWARDVGNGEPSAPPAPPAERVFT